MLFPVLVIVLGEVAVRLRRQGRSYAGSVETLRNLVLPLVAFYLILVYVGELPRDGLVLKLFVTVGSIVLLVAVLGIVNGLIFTADTERRVPKLFLDLGRILLIMLGLAIVLSVVWDYDLNNLITALGVSSIVLGLALQDTLGNLFNGITLINERPFRVGDFIEVDNFSGKVIEVNWRAVRLLTRERDMIVLPHLKVAQSAIINHSQPEMHWAQKLVLGFSYGDPPNRVKEVLYEILEATPGVLQTPKVEVKVETFDASAVNYEIEYYIASFGHREEIRDDFMTRVWYAARRYNLNIPFPQMNLHREPQRELAEAGERERMDNLAYAVELLGIVPETKRLAATPDLVQRYYGKGEYLIEAGLPMPGLFVLLSGEARMTAADGGGETVVLADLHRGDYFTSVLLPGNRQNVVSVHATEDLKVLYFPEAVIRTLVNRYPKLANQVEEALHTRRRQLVKLRKRAALRT